MRKIAIGHALLGWLVVLAIVGCSRQPIPVKPTPTAVPDIGIKAGEQIVAEGQVTPVKSAALSFSIGGIVTQVSVALGDEVKAGQDLAELDTTQLQRAVAEAEAALSVAQANLDLTQAGPQPEEVEIARQEALVAQRQVANAEAALVQAQATLAQAKAGPTQYDLDQAQIAVDQAKDQLWEAQAQRDSLKATAKPGATKDAAEAAVLQAQDAIRTAESRLAQLKAGPSREAIAIAEAGITAAQKQVETAQAQAAAAAARTKLAELGPRPQQVAVAAAQVKQAEAALAQAQAELQAAQLVAPFAGTVMTLDIDAGEYAASGTVVLRLADTSAWQIETTDLTELNIASVQEGMPVTMTFDAIPELVLPGKVTNIEPYGESRQGDIVYTVIIAPDQQDSRLRWNMTAKVSIEAKQ
jgi:HlyD family secretion protein